MIDNFIFPLDYIILAIACITIFICFLKGVISSILGLLTWIGSIIITIYFYNNLSEFINSLLLNINILENYDQITTLTATIISIPLIFLISLFFLKKLRKIISSDLDKQILGIIIDKFFGFLFGFIFNYIIFSTIIYSVNNFEILFFLENWINENSYILKTLEEFNDNLIKSIVNNEVEITN